MSHYGDGGRTSQYGNGGGNDRYSDSSYRGGENSFNRGHMNGSSDNLGANLRSIHWDLSKLPVFEKNFYIEHPAVSGRSDASAEEWRRENEITIVGKGIPKPVHTFEEASMPEYVLKEVLKQGFTKPSPIQSQGWPMALLGRDMIGISATGSGKTLAFLLPAMIHINAQPYLQRGDGPIVLVVAPTRELAMQIKNECDKFGASSEIKNTVVYGGVPKHTQVRDLRNGVEIVIATPGRLYDFALRKDVDLSCVFIYVLDEADRMLDMGFEPQIRKIVSQIRPDRQTLLWSATWPKEVQQLAKDFLINAYEVHVGSMDLRANNMIKQHVEVVSDFDKYPRLTHHLKEYDDGSKVLIFVETKKGCDQLTRSLRGQGYPVRCIHGDKTQQDRDSTLAEFRDGRVPMLVATDVAARGLDVKDVRVVVNFDMPNTIEDYVHRIGRTGRAGARGQAISFFTDKHSRMAKELVEVMYEAGQEVPPTLAAMVPQRGGGGGSYGGGRGGGVGFKRKMPF